VIGLVARADSSMYAAKRRARGDDEPGQPASVPNTPTKLTISPG